MRLSSCLLSAVAIFSFALAAQTTPVPKPQPVIHKIAGQKVEAVWPNGNRAGLFVSRNAPTVIPAEMQVTENLCTGNLGASVRMQMALGVVQGKWVWTQHQDPAKIGETLFFMFNDFKVPNERNLMMSNGSRYLHPSLADGMPDDLITFDQVDWLPGRESVKLGDLLIDGWNAELMYPNPETGDLQNRIVSGENGMRLKPIGPLTARMEHSPDGGFFTFPEAHYFYLFGDVISWALHVEGNFCQIAFELVYNGRREINEYIKNLKPNFVPYVWQEDELSKLDRNFFEEGVHSEHQ